MRKQDLIEVEYYQHRWGSDEQQDDERLDERQERMEAYHRKNAKSRKDRAKRENKRERNYA